MLLTMARSRSSLTAHLLHNHGIWAHVGVQGDQYNRSGYYESRRLKTVIKASRPNIYQTEHCVPSAPIPGFRHDFWRLVRHEGYDTGPLLVKVDAMAWPIFGVVRPIYVGVMRELEGVLDSIRRTPFMQRWGHTEDHWRDIIRRHQEQIADVCEFVVDTDALVAGEHEQLQPVLDYLGLVLDRDLCAREIHC